MSDNDQSGFNYQAEAQQTKSDKFYGDLIALSSFKSLLERCIYDLQTLDAHKKALFYGKEGFIVKAGEAEPNCNEIYSNCIGNEPAEGIDIIHSILGTATEAGEQLELMYACLFDGKKWDEVNFKEEIADGLWYAAIGLEAVGSTFDEVQRTNIAKLRARFPNRFTEYDANNRNLVAERKILES